MNVCVTVYLDVDGVDDIKLAFTFGQTNTVRYWKFNIALLPCGASYLGKKYKRFL